MIIRRSMSRGNRLVMVDVRSSDLDRVDAFHTIGLKLEINVAVTLRLAYMLKRIEKSNLSSRLERPPPKVGKNVKVIKPHKSHLDWWEKEVLDESSMDVFEEPEVSYPRGKILILDSGRMNVFETPPPRGSLHILTLRSMWMRRRSSGKSVSSTRSPFRESSPTGFTLQATRHPWAWWNS